MALALDDVLAAETRESVMADILSIADDVLLKVTAWQPGQPIRTLLVYCSQKIADNTGQNREAIAGGLLDYATEQWLTLLARCVYRVTRNPAQFASGDSYAVTNSGTEEQTFQPNDFIVAHAVTGKTYSNRALLVVPPGTTVEDVVIDAAEIGTGSDAAPGEITEIVSTVPGITGTNVRAVLGADEETDPALRTRCRRKLGALSPNGPKEAYEFIVTTPFFEDGTPCCPTSVPFTRAQVVLDVDNGELSTYCATDAGAPIEDDIEIADAAIDRWATPWLVKSYARAAVEVPVPITYTVWIRGSNLTTVQIQQKISAALAAYFKTIPIGGEVIPPDVDGKLYQGALETVITLATPGIIKVTLTLPSADVLLAQGRVAVLGTIIPNVELVP